MVALGRETICSRESKAIHRGVAAFDSRGSRDQCVSLMPSVVEGRKGVLLFEEVGWPRYTTCEISFSC